MVVSVKSNVRTKQSGRSRQCAGSIGRKCLIPGCGDDAFSRGCCERCLRSLRRQVANGTTSWSRLIKAGFVLEARQRGRMTPATEAVRNLIK